MSTDNRRSYHSVRSGANQLRLCLFFGCPGNDVDIWIQISSSQYHINIICIIGQTRCETTSVFNSSVAQAFLQCGITNENSNARIHQERYFLWVALENEQRLIASLKTADKMRTNSPSTANDKMISKFAHLA